MIIIRILLLAIAALQVNALPDSSEESRATLTDDRTGEAGIYKERDVLPTLHAPRGDNNNTNDIDCDGSCVNQVKQSNEGADTGTNSNTQDTDCDGSCVTSVEQSNQGGADNENKQSTECYGSCITYVNQSDSDTGTNNDQTYTECDGSCVTYYIGAAARRFLPGSFQRRDWKVLE